MATLQITKTAVDALPLTTSGQQFYRDTKLKGFGIRIGTQSKVYYAETKVAGRTVRATIGQHGALTPEEARKRARTLLGDMAAGVNPNAREKAARAQSVTLGTAFTAFLDVRKGLKAGTVYNYRQCMNVAFADWQEKALSAITRDLVERRHKALGENRGPAYANLAMRVLRSVFSFAIAKYEAGGEPVLRENPVRRLSQTRAWYRVERRQTVIKSHELSAWFKAVDELPTKSESPNAGVLRDYLMLALFTGLRRQEAACLKWSDIDFRARTLIVRDTKNRSDHTLPLSTFLVDLLTQRRLAAERTAEEASTKAGPDGDPIPVSPFVFPGEGKDGHLVEPRRQMARVVTNSGVAFTMHDLRRTFITIAESLDIPAYAIKRLANHKMSGDVTAGYIVADVERLRGPMQKITDYILQCADVPGIAVLVDGDSQSHEATQA